MDDEVSKVRDMEAASMALAVESMQRVSDELVRAATVLVQSGFAEPPGQADVAPDPMSRLRWNIAYNQAVKRWIESDPDWQSIGGAARCAADLLNAGVAIQIAARGVQDGRAPITTAVALHNMSVVFGAMRVHLAQWLEGQPQKLAAQRARAASLKAADWYPSVEALILEDLGAGIKVDAIAARARQTLGTNPQTGAEPPSHDAVRVKIQRVRKSLRK